MSADSQPIEIARAAMRQLLKQKLDPTPENYAEAWRTCSGVTVPGPADMPQDHTDPVIELDRSKRAVVDLQRLLAALCDNVELLCDGDSFLRGQLGALRTLLRPGELDRRAIGAARQLLQQTAITQERLIKRRREAGRQLMETLSQLDVGQPDEHLLAVRDRARQLQAEVARMDRELADASDQMLTDYHTQLLNRQGLAQVWQKTMQRAHRLEQPLAVALLDIDDYRALNDAFGHLAADGAIQHLARLLQARLRPGDSVGHFGGEEFVLLLPGSSARSAADVMQRLQLELARDAYLFESTQVTLTFSAGVTEWQRDEDFACVLERADDAMHRAKRTSRNAVAVG